VKHTGLLLAAALAACASNAASTHASMDPVTHEVVCSDAARHRIWITLGGPLVTLGFAASTASAFDSANDPNPTDSTATMRSVDRAEGYLGVGVTAIVGLASAIVATRAWSSYSDCQQLDHRVRELQLAAGDCQAVLRLAGEISAIDTAFYNIALAGDPTIARCRSALPDSPLQSPAERGAARAAAALGHRVTANELTESARDAARRWDCATAVNIGIQLLALDANFHDTVFVHDAAIAPCLPADQK
jgi:hypothetical protein